MSNFTPQSLVVKDVSGATLGGEHVNAGSQMKMPVVVNLPANAPVGSMVMRQNAVWVKTSGEWLQLAFAV